MPAPTLSADEDSLDFTTIPGREYALGLISETATWGATVNVVALDGTNQLPLESYTVNDGDAILAPTETIRVILDGTPAAPITVRLTETTGK
jgi:hypothetical protein